MCIEEIPFLFGTGHQLFGIVSKSSGGDIKKTGVILLNSGLIHRAGPFRMGVTIARTLAASGFPVLRFDQSARGDSERRRGVDVSEAANSDIEEAKTALQKYMIVENIVLIGLCSGADDIVRYVADKGDDITGLVLMDPYAPKTIAFYLYNYMARALSWTSIQRYIVRRLSTKTKIHSVESEETNFRTFRECPDAARLARAIRNVYDREGAVLAVFTCGVHSYYNHKGQLTRGLKLQKLASSIEEVYFKTAEHTYPLTTHRDQLVRTIEEFCLRRFS